MKESKKAREKVLVRIWDNLEEIHEQMISGMADDLTLRELEAVDAAVEKILTTTTGWFNRTVEGTIKKKRAP